MITIHGLEAKRYSITTEGLNELRQQFSDLKKRRTEIANEMQDITSQNGATAASGDSTLTDIQKHALEIDGVVVLLERVIALVDVIQTPTSNHEVQIGSHLSVRLNDITHTYTIVGSIEADPAQGKISNESPLGQLLLGKKVNDQFEIVMPKNSQRQQAVILSIT
jgi:transcription elongation factor GreA